MLILNEEKYAKEVYLGLHPEIKSLVTKIGYVTRYFKHVLKYDDDLNYKSTVEWAQQYHNNFEESCYSKLISDAIKRARKKSFYHTDNIKITQAELDAITSLENLRAEKLLFVLLCMAKHQARIYGFTDGLVRYSLQDLCKNARISVPSEDREYLLHYIIQRGALECPKKNDTKCLIVKCIDDQSDVVLDINEIDSQELAYVYLNWKSNGAKYKRCEVCGRLMQKKKDGANRFCRSCAERVGSVPDDVKVIVCVDCGKLVYISKGNNRTNRCEECYQIHRRTQKNEAMRKLRSIE